MQIEPDSRFANSAVFIYNIALIKRWIHPNFDLLRVATAASFVSSVTPSGELSRQTRHREGEDKMWTQREQDRGTDSEKQRVCAYFGNPSRVQMNISTHYWSRHCHSYSLSQPFHLPLPVSPSCSLSLSDSNSSHVFHPLSRALMLRLSLAPAVPQGIIK